MGKKAPRVQSITLLSAHKPYLAHREVTSVDCLKDIQALLTQGWTITDCRLQKPINPADTEA
jgi:ribulose bisphosphate carboxylase small subunit